MSFIEKIKEFGLDPNSIQNGLKNINFMNIFKR
jgi:hypothetical protein